MGLWIDDAIARALSRLKGIAAETADFPHITENGTWQCTPDGVWTGGFWAGLLWLAWKTDQEDRTLKAATAFTDRLLLRAEDKHNHDLGFMFFPSAVRGWQLTGEQRFHEGAIRAAYALAGQFNTRAGYIPGWGFFGGEDWSGSVLVDTLMNLPLLVWAAERGAGPGLMDVVHRQVETTLRNHLRHDGSVFHVYRFDPASGQPRGGDTYQGLAPDSSWARGQSWAITGLGILAQMTGAPEYLAASERVAAYFLDHLPADGVPPWDFKATGNDQPKDSAAGAIASYGFQKLFRVTGNRMYFDAASKLLHALASTCGNKTDRGGLLLHSTADLPHGLGIDESTMYGDFYYLKSLISLKTMSLDAGGRHVH
ncbi:glycoside hydrolase family 88 protein [Limobrevibacterium gyesilva]|uniref:Glycoside hydrolase family 88 protein n=1 Tax=Limobrevibacterium gyesilva TaxID=2991712 RepID=A0AA41YJZ8_9PROT|nr:glycoside hydrolase family 88 protein [Limobrevibacterium gyesilva]MCW3473233.1 glycoside hydrolase family 88 protein [Limobrevibacterium gyesilva]